ncbi:hypothetical protein EDC01DRAFT_617909 [Geopyxis carbonaria]|nr:hypothetical protein EDC01DRAFT_617909 [Geopyxis carbonaria]
MTASLSKTDLPFSEYSPFYVPPTPEPPLHEPPKESPASLDEPPQQQPQIIATNPTGEQQQSTPTSAASTPFEPGADLSSFDASYTRALPGHRGGPAPGMEGWKESTAEETTSKTWEEDLERRAKAGAELQKRAEEAQRREQEEQLSREFWDQEQKDWDQQAAVGAPPSKPPKQMAAASAVAQATPSEGSGVALSAVPMTQEPSRGRTPVNPETEIYQIKHVNLISPGSEEVHRVPILLQNANGPCPLMALVNSITLTTPTSVRSALSQTLEFREQISLSLLLQVVFEELMTHSQGLPDIGDLFAFLTTLHTGMNVNPRFDTPPDSPGGFESTREYALYGSFNVPLVHGWLPEPNSPTAEALARSAKTYDESMLLLFAEEEAITRLTSSATSTPSPADQTLLQDAGLVRAFVESSATQLTPHGLTALRSSLPTDRVAILFRNDHFSSVLRRGSEIYTLVTDLGYASHEEVVWERIGDVSGRDNTFLSGDFRPVGGRTTQPPISSMLDPPAPPPRRSSAAAGAPRIPTPPADADEDYDLALAMQLQEEENARSGSNSGTAGEATGRVPPPVAPALPPRARTSAEELPPPYERQPQTGRRPQDLRMPRRGAAPGSAGAAAAAPVVAAPAGPAGKVKEDKCVVM